MKKFLLSALFALPFLAHADGLPDMGDASQDIISPQMERQIGEQSMFQIRSDKTYLDDPEISDYLNQLGGRLVARPDPRASEAAARPQPRRRRQVTLAEGIPRTVRSLSSG